MSEEKKLLNDESIKDISGGAWRPDSKMARVYSIDGGDVKMYNTSISCNTSSQTSPNSTGMTVDTNLPPEQPWIAGLVYEACYWACYNNVWVALKANEVRFEWIGE